MQASPPLRGHQIPAQCNKGITRSLFPDGRVRASGWNQLAARTGRIISTEPNLQQVPRDWRTGFRVDPPKLWLKGDLSQIEVVIIAVVTGDQNLIGVLRAGKDVYVEVAARVFGVKAMRSEEEGFVTDKLRNVAKIIVLGTSYGLTIYGFVRQIHDELGIEFGLDEADRFFREFFGMFPGIEAYHLKASEDSLTVESVLTARGTRRYLPALQDDNEVNGYWPSREFRKRVLLNTPIQGGGADLQIRAVNKFMGRLPDGLEVINLVHDEVDLILPTDLALFSHRESDPLHLSGGFCGTLRDGAGPTDQILRRTLLGRDQTHHRGCLNCSHSKRKA